MAKTAMTNNSHVTTGCVFEDLGFSPEEAAVLRLKTTLHIEITKEVKRRKLTQKEVCRILGLKQPQVDKLLKGGLQRTTADKLTKYLRLLGLEVNVRVGKVPMLKRSEVA